MTLQRGKLTFNQPWRVDHANRIAEIR